MRHSLSKIFEKIKGSTQLSCARTHSRRIHTSLFNFIRKNLGNALALREVLNGNPVPKRLRNQYSHTHAVKRLQHEFELKVRHRLFIRCMKYYTTLKFIPTYT